MPHVGRKMSRRSSILAGGGRRRSSIVGGGGSKTGTTTTTTVPADDGGENAETTTLSAIVALLPRKPKPLGPSTGCNGGKANNNKRRRPPSSSADKTPAGSLQAAAGQLLGAAVPSPSAAAAAGGAADGARGKKRDRAGDADLGDDELQGQKQEQGGIGFNCLPADVTARILFSGYFDTAFVLGRYVGVYTTAVARGLSRVLWFVGTLTSLTLLLTIHMDSCQAVAGEQAPACPGLGLLPPDGPLAGASCVAYHAAVQTKVAATH